MTVLNCSDYPDFRVGAARTDTAYFYVIGKGGDIFCVSNAHCIQRYFEGLTAIYLHMLIIYAIYICYFALSLEYPLIISIFLRGV
jgi:hypothetical protein